MFCHTIGHSRHLDLSGAEVRHITPEGITPHKELEEQLFVKYKLPNVKKGAGGALLLGSGLLLG